MPPFAPPPPAKPVGLAPFESAQAAMRRAGVTFTGFQTIPGRVAALQAIRDVRPHLDACEAELETAINADRAAARRSAPREEPERIASDFGWEGGNVSDYATHQAPVRQGVEL